MIIWITGVPGSGKTSLSKRLKTRLEPKISNNIVLLDGDNIRDILPYKKFYSNEERKKLSFFYSKLALLIERSNCTVICAFVALFNSVQEHTRLNSNDYFEIFLDPPIEELVKKNKKGLYSENSEYMVKQYKEHEFPINPELRLNTILNGVYQDYSAEITKEIMKRMETSF